MEKRSYSAVNRQPARFREREGIIFGAHPVEEALRSGKQIDKILLNKDGSGIIHEIAKMAAELRIPVQRVPLEKLHRETDGNHQGVIAYVSPIDYADLETVVSIALFQKKVPLVLVLDRLTDVRNLGAIARTAECAGVTAIVIPNKESAPINADAMKTSAGALNYIPVCRVDNLIDAILLLQQSGLQVFAASEKATKTIYETDFTVPMALIMGNEEEGVSPQLLRRANELLTIPMVGKIDSLNVSVAAGVMVYEVIRQRMGV